MYSDPHDHQIHEYYDELLNFENKPAVSIYMPAHKVKDSNREDPIRLKNCFKREMLLAYLLYMTHPKHLKTLLDFLLGTVKDACCLEKMQGPTQAPWQQLPTKQ